MSQGKGGRQQKEREPRKRKVEKGIVMSVPSGDRIVVYQMDNQPHNTQKWTPPKKREIKLAGITAPNPGRTIRKKTEKPKAGKGGRGKGKRNGKEETEEKVDSSKEASPAQPKAEDKGEHPAPFFWESRNFLRELTIGKVVEYEVFQTKQQDAKANNPSAIPRELGNVKLQGQEENLSRVMVAAGWALAKAPKETKDATAPPKSFTDLLALQQQAQKELRGVHAPKTTKPIAYNLLQEFDHWQKCKEWKGQTLTGIVEAVLSGSFLRITVAPSFHSIPLRIAGVRSPNYKKDGDSDAFGNEAQFTTERYVLNRTIQIKLTTFEQQGNKKDADEEEKQDRGVFHGEIFLNGKSIGELLLQSGLASFVEWSCPKEKVDAYKKLEAQAQQGRLRMWQAPNAVQQSQKPANSWLGRVKGVVSGSTLTIQNMDANPPRLETISLSSIAVSPLSTGKKGKDRKGQKGEKGDKGEDEEETSERKAVAHERYAWEAREFVRKRLIGKKVRVTLDYIRPELEKDRRGEKDAKGRSKGKEKIPEKPFYTVEHDKRNIALALVENGLATVQQTRGDNRSPHYDALILAEDRAKSKKIGLHNDKETGKQFINDVSRSAKQAKQLYPTLSGRPVEAVVEYVISGSRIKLYLPRENVMISFALAGVRSPAIPAKKKPEDKNKNTKAKEGEEKKPEKPEKEQEIPPFAIEARDFTRDFTHHYDVEIEIEGQDLAGTFKGYLWRKKQNLAELLLAEGLATLSTPASKRLDAEYANIANKAKDARKGIWKDYDPVKEQEELSKQESSTANAPTTSTREGGPVKVLLQVTEVLDGGTFYSQIIGDEKTKLDELMKQIAERDNAAQPPYKAKNGDTVLARFSGDQAWYRAKILNDKGNGEYNVLYGDFGNVETTDVSQLRELPAEFSVEKLRFQARECKLAFIEPRRLDQDWGEKAALVFKRFVWDKSLMACIEYHRNSVMYVTLWDESKLFINGELVRKGLARVERRLPRGGSRQDLIKFLREQEEAAHDHHKGLWEHGDPGFSDEES